MAVSSHEMYLVLKVRDEGSRMLRAFGSEFSKIDKKAMAAAQRQLSAGAALTTVGVGIAAAGVAGLAFFNDAVNASMRYTEASALTLTQVDKLGVSLEQVKDIGRRVANEVPVAFDSIQTGLYDIFSSMEVSMPQAEMMLTNLSKAAVAGAVDVSTAARATIGILNAYKLPASDVNKVNDVMFQLVRKGIGTYKEFTGTIGRAIPSAVKAGQSYKDVAGMLAFLTRNNMSAAMSASATSRAMDAISKTKSIDHLRRLGIAVVDAHGKFRPMVEIMGKLREKLSHLSPAARAAKLDEIFKGSGGTIQAMRFFNLATGKAGPLLDLMTTAMHKANGAAKAAYQIMSNTPQAKIALLNNRYQVMKSIVGDQLLPAKMKLVEALGKLLSWWNGLDKQMQKNIVTFGAISAALFLVVGVILAIVGVMLMLAAAAAMADIALAPLIGTVALIVVGVGLFIGAIIFLIANHEQMQRGLTRIWGAIQTIIGNVVGFVIDRFRSMVASWFWANGQLLSGAATVAEKLHLPYAKSLRQASNSFNAMAKNADDKLRGIATGAFKWGDDTGSNYAAGLKRSTPAINTAASNIHTAVRGGLVLNNANALGSGVAVNYANGIAYQKQYAASRARDVANGVRDGLPIPGAFGVGAGISSMYAAGIAANEASAVFAAQQIAARVQYALQPGAAALRALRDAPTTVSAKVKSSILAPMSRVAAAPIWKAGPSLPSAASEAAASRAAAKAAKAASRAAAASRAKAARKAASDAARTVRAARAARAKTIRDAARVAATEARRQHDVLLSTGKYLGTGLVVGMTGTLPQVQAASAKMGELIRSLGWKKSGRDELALSYLARSTRLLQINAIARAKVADDLKAAQGKLNDAIKIRDDFAKSVRDSVATYGSVAAITVEVGRKLRASNIVKQLTTRLAAVKAFVANMAALKASGLNKTAYEQLIGAGVEGGGAAAAALAAGGATAIASVNSLQSEINTAGDTLGTEAAAHLYQAGVDAAAGLVRGLTSQSTALATAATTLARNLVAAIKKALGIHSKSTVMAAIGRFTGLGLAQGILDTQGQVQHAMDNVTSIMSAPSLRPSGAGGAAGLAASGGGTTKYVEVKMDVHTQEINPVKHAADLGWEVARAM